MTEKISSCDHIGIFTNSPGRLIKFYTEKLGFSKEKEDVLSKSIIESIFGVSSDCNLVRLGLGDVKIEIFQLVPALKNKVDDIVGYNHWGFCVADREEFLQKLKRDKVGIIEVKRNDHSAYFIKDPDGNRIEIRKL